MDLPPSVRSYFNAERLDDVDDMLGAFASDATVKDEGGLHVGKAAIRDWWMGARTKYNQKVEPLDCTRESDVVRVRARVTGDFPGSPVILSFVSKLEQGLITRLEIDA